MADSYVIRQGTERNTNPMFMEIMAKDLTELAKYASRCTPGSLGYLEDATVYRLGTQGTWVKVGDDFTSRLAEKADVATTYTKTEVDTEITDAIAPVTSQLAEIARDMTELQNTGVDTTARARVASLEGKYAFATSKNLIDHNDVVTGAVQPDGTISTAGAWANYVTTGLRPVTPGASHILSYVSTDGVVFNAQRLIVLLYDENQSMLAGTYQEVASGTISFANANAYYARVTFMLVNQTDKYYYAQLELGTTPSNYTAYFDPKEIALADLPAVNSKALRVFKDGNNIIIRGLIGTNEAILSAKLADGVNSLFNFYRFMCQGIQQACADDVTPLRMPLSTVGANHGYSLMFRCTKNGQALADAGSLWSSGGKTYTLVMADDNYVYFVCPYTETDGIVGADVTYPSAELTHVSGATHTDTISVTGMATNQSLPRSVNNYSIDFVYDGVRDATDGTRFCDAFVVRERYNIIDYKALQTFLAANVGVDYRGNNAIDGCVEVAIDYTFGAGCKCLVSTKVRAFRKVTLSDCGFVQASALNQSGYTLKRYMPNVNSKSGYDFGTPVLMTSYASNLVFATTDLKDDAEPPNRYCDVLFNASSAPVLGFSAGYIPDRSHGKDALRLTNTPTMLWEMRSTQKVYPVALKDKTMNAGDVFTVLCYRCYFVPSRGETIGTYIDCGGTAYAFVDYHSAYTGVLSLDGKYVGKAVTVLDSTGLTLNSDVVDMDGIAFSVADSYGYGVFKIS